MAWVTHELLIVGQTIGACAYTLASFRLWRRTIDRPAVVALSVGVALDLVLAVLGATSELGDNPHGMPWGHPLFAVAVVLATMGMLGYMIVLVLLLVRKWRDYARTFVAYSQLVIWPSWMIGVTLFVLNVFVGWF